MNNECDRTPIENPARYPLAGSPTETNSCDWGRIANRRGWVSQPVGWGVRIGRGVSLKRQHTLLFP